MVASKDFIDESRRSISTYTFRVELLDINENFIEEIDTSDILDGSINVTLQNGSRRNATITVRNDENKYNLNPASKFWLNRKVQIYTGFIINGQVEDISQGIFEIGEPNEGSSQSNKTVSLELYDKFSFLDDTLSGQLIKKNIIPNGTNVVTAIRDIFELSTDDKSAEVKPLIAEPNSYNLPYTLEVDQGDTYFTVMNKLAEAITHDLYYDRDGFPRFEPPTDLDNDSEVISFAEEDILKIDLSKRLDTTELYNVIRVEGFTSNTGVIFNFTAQDTNPSSPTSVANIRPRALLIRDEVISTEQQAEDRANFELQNRTAIFETITLSIYPVDILDVGDIVSITDRGLNVTNERYQVRQLTIPLRKDVNMTMDVWKIRSFS